jgi:hypothetical protein
LAIQGKVDSTDCVCIKNAASGDQLQKVILKARKNYKKLTSSKIVLA